ncbi:MAG: hypothetical protein KGK04_13470 [Xanthomonadaceae bacterium]|nr:hypothetical protein [Xanthomonadaceae bacterium]
MSDSSVVTPREIAACGASFPDLHDWLPLNEHSGRAHELAVDASGASHEMIWLFLDYALHLCKSHERPVAGIGLPDKMYRGLNISATETPSYQGHHVLQSCIRLGCDDHLLLMFEGDENVRSPLPSPESWLPRGRLGTRGCFSTIALSGVSMNAAMVFLEDAFEVCREREYKVDAISLPWNPRITYPGGLPSKFHGIDWIPDDWSPCQPRIGLEFHQPADQFDKAILMA